MAIFDGYSTTTSSVTTASVSTASGTYAWYTTDPYGYHYIESTPESSGLNYMPDDVPDVVEPIQGKARGAKWLVSYAFKKSKDPVVFVKNEKDMKLLVERLLKDEKVDKRTILIHKISQQFKPKLVVKREKVVQKVESVELNPLKAIKK